MKSTMYFNSEDEMNEYFPNGVPSNVLAIVQPEGSDKSVLFTTSNNNSKSGTIEDMGGYNIDDENEEKIEYSYLGVQDWYANGATHSYVVNYVAEHGGGSTPDLSAYVTKDELSGMSYATTTYVADYVSTYGGGSQVQADWNESDSSADSYILNKPNIGKGTGNYSVTLGFTGNTASGLCSVAEGNGVMATGTASHAEGEGTWASGNNSHAEGSQNTKALGNMSHAEGRGTQATKEASHSEGVNTQSKGWGSHTEGVYNNAYNVGEHAEGYYNLSHTNGSAAGNQWYSEATYTVHSVGIGTGDNDRKNALEIMQNGDLYTYGVGNYDGTNFANAYTLAYVINDIQTNLGAANSIAELILGE